MVEESTDQKEAEPIRVTIAGIKVNDIQYLLQKNPDGSLSITSSTPTNYDKEIAKLATGYEKKYESKPESQVSFAQVGLAPSEILPYETFDKPSQITMRLDGRDLISGEKTVYQLSYPEIRSLFIDSAVDEGPQEEIDLADFDVINTSAGQIPAIVLRGDKNPLIILIRPEAEEFGAKTGFLNFLQDVERDILSRGTELQAFVNELIDQASARGMFDYQEPDESPNQHRQKRIIYSLYKIKALILAGEARDIDDKALNTHIPFLKERTRFKEIWEKIFKLEPRVVMSNKMLIALMANSEDQLDLTRKRKPISVKESPLTPSSLASRGNFQPKEPPSRVIDQPQAKSQVRTAVFLKEATQNVNFERMKPSELMTFIGDGLAILSRYYKGSNLLVTPNDVSRHLAYLTKLHQAASAYVKKRPPRTNEFRIADNMNNRASISGAFSITGHDFTKTTVGEVYTNYNDLANRLVSFWEKNIIPPRKSHHGGEISYPELLKVSESEITTGSPTQWTQVKRVLMEYRSLVEKRHKALRIDTLGVEDVSRESVSPLLVLDAMLKSQTMYAFYSRYSSILNYQETHQDESAVVQEQLSQLVSNLNKTLEEFVQGERELK